ncbi:hypothetical protein BFX40_32485 [Mesorhizobium sp. SEMIA 3007]|uniref:DUF6998 domain-containing protein n=1 Tax=unclassified Mesorhizobium TaxID=325217 RepID=UPI00083D3BF3|nr:MULTISPECIES: hypothetical protein [unclassified Mesorhizobium]ODA97103.1 hypothetical protein BFX40_32485 [Mesorhizobium sp. SEMIA 3007]BCH07706.1 hypothetical protein MesoLj131c_19640 [Mesorhizobium sp. 131-3-5]
MALTQIQTIQSLAEALTWFERELSWGVDPANLGHLTGRIGELFTCVLTRGQMALEVNQRGYDVVSADNERISVKTITSSTSVSFNPNTFEHVDRVVILRINVGDDNGVSVETLLDCTAAEARTSKLNERLVFSVGTQRRFVQPVEHLAVVDSSAYGPYTIKQYENGTILVFEGETKIEPAKPLLRKIASEIGFDILNDRGEQKNTRQIGAGILRMLAARA